MKSAVETLNPTRVRLTVEVPFEELQPSLEAAYKRISATVTIPGFRKGKVPSRLIDQRFGRGVVLEEAVNDALPKLYTQAVQDSGVAALGTPEVDVTRFADGEPLEFTAEVDVRPEIVLPEYRGLEVVVDDAEVADDDVEEQLQLLRERFGVLRGVDRAAGDGDFVSLDLAASVDGEPLEDATARGMSYQVGSGDLLDGLDAAVTGMGAGESGTFTTTLAGGGYEGREAEVAVTVQSVKERELPELDDDFAQTASEFDTLDELRADLRSRIEQMKKVEQGVQARDKALEVLLGRMDVPLPEKIVEAEVQNRMHAMEHQLQSAGLTKEGYLASEGQSVEDFDAEVEQRSRDAVKAQFVLDAIVAKEKLSVDESELSDHIVRRAMRAQMSPEQFAQQVVEAGQVPLLVNEVVRGKALAVVLESAVVVDSSGRPVDLEALRDDSEDDAVEAYLEDDDVEATGEDTDSPQDADPTDDEARQA